MKRLLPHPVLMPTLTLIWLLLNNSLAFGHILLGLFLGWVIPLFTQAFWPDSPRICKPGKLLAFVGLVLYDILVANLRVAWLIVLGAARLKPAFIVIPLDLRNDSGISVLANTICLTPGTVSARLSDDSRFLLVHALDNNDTAGLVAEIKARYEAPLMEIFEC